MFPASIFLLTIKALKQCAVAKMVGVRRSIAKACRVRFMMFDLGCVENLKWAREIVCLLGVEPESSVSYMASL